VLTKETNRKPYIIQTRGTDKPQDIDQNKNAKMLKTGWQVDDLNKLKQKSKG